MIILIINCETFFVLWLKVICRLGSYLNFWSFETDFFLFVSMGEGVILYFGVTAAAGMETTT